MKPRKTRPKRVRQLPWEDQAFFCRQLAFVVRAGVPLGQAGAFLRQTMPDGGQSDILSPVFALVESGETFAGALRRSGLFSEYLAAVVALGETTGNLDRALEELADYFESASVIRHELRSAFSYPLILCGMMLAVILFLIIEMLPQFASILAGAGGRMPAAAQGLLMFGQFLRSRWLPLLGALAAVVLAGRFFLKSRKGRELTGRFLLDSRFFGAATRSLATARFCSAMRMALGCGHGFAESVRLSAQIAGNPAVKARLERLGDQTERGDIPAAVGEAGVFPEPFVRLFATAYRTGNLEETMEKMADYYAQDFDRSVSAMTARVEPALVIALSCVAGVILFTVMMPIIHIMQSIG